MKSDLPWFGEGKFPLYLAPMAGVTDVTFREICKEEGADVLVTEFVSADGIAHRSPRTREYLEFTETQRPLGVQLFGAEAERMAEAARSVVEWVRPDFVDLNFGCPAKKVVGRNGGSGLLRDCPLLRTVAASVVRAAGPLPVTAKMRIGWDRESVNAVDVARMLEDAGVQAIAVHGRTRAQGYSGEADWDVIGAVAAAVRVPVIGNGDLSGGADVKRRREGTGVAGVMIGRAAMGAPWIFNECKEYLATGRVPEPVPLERRWEVVLRHCRAAVAAGRRATEEMVMSAMRARLMAYSRGMPAGRRLRGRFAQVTSLAELEDIATEHLAAPEDFGGGGPEEDGEEGTRMIWNGKLALAG